MAETIIGKTLIVEGEITGGEPIMVLGTLKGKVSLDNRVSVAEGGRVDADITAGVVEVSGVMNGNITVSDRLEIKTGGRMYGDISAPRILISDGALYKGNIDMERSGGTTNEAE